MNYSFHFPPPSPREEVNHTLFPQAVLERYGPNPEPSNSDPTPYQAPREPTEALAPYEHLKEAFDPRTVSCTLKPETQPQDPEP